MALLKAPEVTVLLPVYNGEAYLRTTIESLLAQTFEHFELLIVDDGSTDRTSAIATGYDDPRVRVERFETNRGLSAALNRGLQLATAPLIARQDADDISRPDRLAAQVAFLRAHPDVALVGSLARAIDEAGRPVQAIWRPVEDPSVRWYALLDNPFIHTSVVFRRDAAMASGGFDAAFDPFSQDYALWWRIMRRHRVANLPEPLVDYRVNPASIMGQADQSPEGAQRTRFEGIVRQLVPRHVLEAYAERGLSADDAELMTGYVVGIPASDVLRFLSVFGRLLEWFERDHPGVRRSRDFSRTLARQYDAIAYRLRPPTRALAARVYGSGLRRRPRLLATLPLANVAALMMVGKSGRARLARWRETLARA
jgi:hypothetical protein